MADVHDAASSPMAVINVADGSVRAALAKAAAGELLSGTEMRAIFGLGRTQFWALKKAGKFNAFIVAPAIGVRCFSGVLVHRYLSGDPVYGGSFGRKGVQR